MPCIYDHDSPIIHIQPAEGYETKVGSAKSDSSSRLAGRSVTPAGPSLAAPPESRERRLLELRLLHQYTKKTARDLLVTYSARGEQLWATACPRLAFEHDAVLYAMFALAALHIAKADPIWPYSEAMDTHRKYLDLALPAHSDDVAHLKKENADAACIASSLLRICAFAYLSERPLDPYTPPLQWLQMTSGSGMVFNATWDWIHKNEDSLAGKLLNRTPILTPFNESLFLESNRQGFEHLVEQRDSMEPWSPDIEHAYQIAVSYIGSMLIAIDAGEEQGGDICRRAIAFPMLVHPGFITLVEEQQPRALVVLAHYFAVLARFKDLWWMGDSGRREMIGIQTILPTEWQEAMRWPLNAIEEDRRVFVAQVQG